MASTTGSTGWAGLPGDLLGCVIARLPFPGDRAAICAACRAWRTAARRFVRHQAPWIVLPDCSVCTTGRDGAFFDRIPGLPDNVTCLAAAAEGWLALDLTDDAFRRTPFMETYCPDTRTFRDARPDVKHSHTYLLHNPFTNVTVPLPELDDLVGHVAETFWIRKVLMRSSSSNNPAEDVIAVTTSNWKYNIILCRPGKGTFVLPNFRVIDVAFVGDTLLYGITSGEELLAFHLGEDDDGRPKVTRFELVIENPMAAYYHDEFPWSWPQINDTSSGGDDENQNHDDKQDAVNEEENQYQEEDDEDEESDDEDYDDEFNGDGAVSDNEVREKEDGENREVPYDATDEIYTARYLVRSLSGELLLVRHGHLSSPYSSSYSCTLNVEVFKADLSAGRWVLIDDGGLGEGEALFLSRSTRAHGGDVKDGFVYYAAAACLGEEAFNTRSRTIRQMTSRRPWQWEKTHANLLTWMFPPELVV
ncbi:unnamed protein product [Urochloa humidicola]